MDYEKLTEELDRLMDELKMIDPSTPKYEAVLKRCNELHRMFLAEDKCREDQVERRHKQELEDKKHNLEEKKFDLESKKFKSQEKNDELRNMIEKDRIEIDHERIMLEDRKLDIQEADNEETHRIEEERIQAEIADNHVKARYTKGQAIWRLVEIGAQGAITMALIITTGKIQETSILDSKLWSLVWKPKI